MKAPYGSWKSPVTTDLIVAECIGLGGSQFVGDTLYWMELRPQEGGRAVLVRREADGRRRSNCAEDHRGNEHGRSRREEGWQDPND